MHQPKHILNSCRVRTQAFVPPCRFGECFALPWKFSNTSVTDIKRLIASHLQSDSLRSLQLDVIIASVLVKCLKDPTTSFICKRKVWLKLYHSKS